MARYDPSAFVSGWDDDNDIEEDPNPRSSPHKEILWAAENGQLELVHNLVEAHPSCVNAKDKDGYTPLHRACYNDHVDIVDYLLSKGADHAAETEDKWQPLHSACRWNNFRSASKLLEHGADINASSLGGQTPLHLAASNSYAKETLTLLLLDPQLDPDLRNRSNETAADLARRCGKYYWMFEMTEPCVNDFGNEILYTKQYSDEVQSESETKGEKPERETEARTEAQTDTKPEEKSEPETEVKAEEQTATKEPETDPKIEPETKSEAKEVQPESEVKTEAP